MKKKIGMDIVFDKETNTLSYRAKWWLWYMPKFVVKIIRYFDRRLK